MQVVINQVNNDGHIEDIESISETFAFIYKTDWSEPELQAWLDSPDPIEFPEITDDPKITPVLSINSTGENPQNLLKSLV